MSVNMRLFQIFPGAKGFCRLRLYEAAANRVAKWYELEILLFYYASLDTFSS